MKILWMLIAITHGLCAYNMHKLTVLTAPVGAHSSHYGGHHAVTRSLLSGLGQCTISFNYNPISLDQVGDVVHVLGGNATALNQVLDLKAKGRVKKIIAGPNIFSLYKPGNRYAQNKLVDLRITPCNWVRDAHLLRYKDLTENDFFAWPAGVDEEFWNPDTSVKKNSHVLIYNKQQKELTKQVAQLVCEFGYKPIIITYGSYNKEQYKKALSQSLFAIFLSRTESQGIALVESWAMDVPTLCWNLECKHNYNGIHYPKSSACPYLSEQTGVSFKTLQDLQLLLEQTSSIFAECTPRAWVLDNMTDAQCAQQLLDAIERLPDE